MKKFVVSILFSFAFLLLSAPIVGTEASCIIGASTLALQYVPMPAQILGLNSNIAARMTFDNAKIAISNAFPETPGIVGKVKLTQGSLRFSQAMVVGQTLYTFPILVNETQLGIFNTEQRLNLQDSFIVSELGIYVSAPASAVDASYPLLTYPNQVSFGAANADAMLALYNGFMTLAVNNDILIPKWDLWRHYKTSQTQQTAALGANSPADQFEGSNDGLYPVEPNVVLIGSKNNVLTIQLPPAGLSAVTAFSRIEILVRGVLAQNSTVVS